jgi:hypothetical protein
LSACGNDIKGRTPAATGAPAPGKAAADGASKEGPAKLGDWVEEGGFAAVALAVEDPARPKEGYQRQPGTRLVAVRIKMGCLSCPAGPRSDVGPNLWEMIDATGERYDREPDSMADHNDWTLTRLVLGKTLEGWLAYEMPEDAEPAFLEYEFTWTSAPGLKVSLRE